MSEPSLFGIGKEQWQFINSFADWLSAIGTLAAVIVSLWLASHRKPRARLSVSIYFVVGAGDKPPFPEYIRFRVVNTGDRPIRISSIAWGWGFGKWGFWKKRHAIQSYEDLTSSRLPVDLSHGEEGRWMVPMTVKGIESWPMRFARELMMPHYRLNLWTLRALATSSIGDVYSAKPDKQLIDELRKACEQIATER